MLWGYDVVLKIQYSIWIVLISLMLSCNSVVYMAFNVNIIKAL
jgi:hypothetical protein